MIDLPPELGADNGGEDLGQDPHPRLLVHNVQFLESLAHGSGQDMVGLQEPAPAGPVLLGCGRRVAISCKKHDLVLEPLEQLVFLGEARQDVGQERVVVGFVRVREGSGVEDEDRPALLGRQGRAVEHRSSHLGQVARVFRALSRRGHS